ncbi:alpha-hydroxy-acid oxidizing protein [Sinomonas sp. ASV486]|uniref:alpha-hydroxy-acid oxidizing protein n=1 Tax=Sinomonas sp. ASV486 TaxID=3051170 RepID=UPI0027DC58F3|nr:alpha-hydroxy-acid oxidizing protein [Sinomonas sp. ASV486]MDQ4490092.1 alpha-hydroxy-acid oxidizing protein [Sinomonas sp. ASV486]
MSESFGRRVQARIYRNGVFGRRAAVPTNPAELERRALARMSREARGYVATGAGMGSTMAANRAAFDRWRLVPRLARDVSARDTSVELFGRRHPAPFLAAPIGVLELAHPAGDLAAARAARAAGVPMIISSQASYAMESIAAQLGDTERWFQLYWSSEDAVVESFVRRAERIGCGAIVVTLDTMVLSWRTLDLDNAFLPFALGMGIAQYTSDPAFRALVNERLASGASGERTTARPTPAAVRSLVRLAREHPGGFRENLTSRVPRASVETFLDVFSRTTLTWSDLAWLRERTRLPILLKGLQHPDDARAALEHGVDGIIVSNHGGRQLDGALGSLDALPGVVEATAGRVPVLFDSGVRCAADAFKALALGAAAVCIGRPYMYGLALAGEEGAREVFEGMRAELDLTMAVAGVTGVDDIGPDSLTADGILAGWS